MIAKKILLYYCFLFAVFITVSGIIVSKSQEQVLLQLIFLPVTVFLGFMILKDLRQKKHNQKDEKPTEKHFRITKTFIFAMLIFCILVTVSVSRIVQNTRLKTTSSYPQQDVKGVSLPTQAITPSPTPYVIIRPNDQRSKINIRISPLTSAKVIKKAEYDEKYPLAQEEEKWYKIILEDGTFGYVSKEISITSNAQNE
ncbi:MAG: SH3 domain-containing protein [Patescibacteria group bacterium]